METLTASVSFEVQFRCCICLDTYTDPVSIPCGHNFCLDCIEGFWDTKDKSECPLCKETFANRPQLRINRGFAEIVEIIKRSQSPTSKQEEDVDVLELPGRDNHSPNELFEAEEVPCDICCGNKSTSVKSCLVCQASYCELHLTPHLRDPALQRHRLTDPATFPSSHLCRKHNEPLTMFCKRDQMPVCVKCTGRDHKHHKTVPIEKESKRIETNLKETKASLQQMIHTRLKKMEQITNSVDLSKKNTEREIQSNAQACTMLITAIERQHAGLVEELKEKQEEAERRAEELLVELEEEINNLQMRNSELQHLELTQNPLHLLQSFPSLSKLPSTKEWSEVAVHSDNCMGTVRRAIAKIVDTCQELSATLSAEEADKMNQYALDVTLDPETASGWLVLSPDRKQVSLSSQKKAPLADNPQRFDSCVCVLGKQSFTSGRRYWVVQVGDKTDWDLGVARESINRKGAIMVRPDSGYWAICRRKGGSLSACTSPSVTLHLQEPPQKVGVFLDYEEGSVSFYDAEAKTHIYTYSGCTFAEPLYPYFNPCVQDNGKNTAPLIICPVEGRVREVQNISIESDV
ncbi:E3 ubiquitin-protein ligase TRIM39-like isoform X2 [Morone saxatilis]|uniref:E3 ubiquitin-protein ligase TRIM39-like isoform X2 n=1 Tax=Morone saxatilis TaxID=34816 RepID=UPI0015E22E81|nr:E3 ubiquitin-protein ligase TRIM39-like isoform X2 [Morone saxatilis]